MSICCVGALLVVTLFLNSELAVGAVTELWAAADDESVTVVDNTGEVVVGDAGLLQDIAPWVLDPWG